MVSRFVGTASSAALVQRSCRAILYRAALAMARSGVNSDMNLILPLFAVAVVSIGGCAAPSLPGEVLPRSSRFGIEPSLRPVVHQVDLRERFEPEASARFEKPGEARLVRWIEAGTADQQEQSGPGSPWDWFSALAISPDGRWAAVAGRLKGVWGLGVYAVDVSQGFGLKHNPNQWFWRGMVDSVAFSTDGLLLAWSGQSAEEASERGGAGLWASYVTVNDTGPMLEAAGAIRSYSKGDRWLYGVTPATRGRVQFLSAEIRVEGVVEVRPESWQPWEAFASEGETGPKQLEWSPGTEDESLDVCVGLVESPRADAQLAVGSRSGGVLRSDATMATKQLLGPSGIVAVPVWLRSRPLSPEDYVAFVTYDSAAFGHDITVSRIQPASGDGSRHVDERGFGSSDDLCPAFYRDDRGKLDPPKGLWLVYASNATDGDVAPLPGWRLFYQRVNFAAPAEPDSAAPVDAGTSPSR